MDLRTILLVNTDTLDETELRHVLGCFATGVCVVTAVGADGRPSGMTVNSYTSVSLDPPLVLFCVRPLSRVWFDIEASGSFVVNVLALDQEEVSRIFSSRAEDKFAEVGYSVGSGGAPIIDGVIAWLDCTLEHQWSAGDHLVAVGRVRSLESPRDAAPLTFFRSRYRSLVFDQVGEVSA